MFQVKIGYSDDGLKEDAFLFGCFKADFRLRPMKGLFSRTGYLQFQFPISLYYFDLEGTDAFAIDIRFRPELGPPGRNWIPLFFPELGYLYTSKD